MGVVDDSRHLQAARRLYLREHFNRFLGVGDKLAVFVDNAEHIVARLVELTRKASERGSARIVAADIDYDPSHALLKNGEHPRRQRGCVEGRALKVLGYDIDSRRFELVLIVRGTEIGVDYIEIDKRYPLAALRRI